MNNFVVKNLSLLPVAFALVMDDICQLWLIMDYRNFYSTRIFLLIFLYRKGHFRPVGLPPALYFASLNKQWLLSLFRLRSICLKRRGE